MIALNSQILDKDSNQPVPYAQIKIVGEPKGTQADVNGRFRLNVLPGSLIEIVSIGYYKRRDYINSNPAAFYLDPNPVEIQEITIRPEKKESKTTGFDSLAILLLSVFLVVTDWEREKLLPIMIAGLSTKIGATNAVSSSQIISRLKLKKGIDIAGPRIRKLIQHIRLNNLLPGLIASSKGYYMAIEKAELKEYAESLQQRINAIQELKSAVLRDLENIIE